MKVKYGDLEKFSPLITTSREDLTQLLGVKSSDASQFELWTNQEAAVKQRNESADGIESRL